MTCHNKTVLSLQWKTVKAEIIRHHGTVRAVARKIGCHHNAIRYAAEGRCPRVLARLVKLIPSIQP